MRWTLLLVVAACDASGAVAPDAGPDAGHFELPGCPATYEHGVFIGELIEAMRPEEGRDLDGDGDIDNAIGVLGPLLNDAFADNIETGAITLMVIPELMLPPPATPRELVGFVPDGYDVDDPPDPSNNFEDGEFLIDLDVFDAACQPRLPMDLVQDGLSITGDADRLEIPAVGGRAEVRRFRIDATVAEDGSRVSAVLAGAFTSCALERLSFPGPTPGSALGGIVAFGMQPDLDLDGDGLETLVLEDGAIARCVDGPGSGGTVIVGENCACDPSIVDGYSVALHTESVPARIVGASCDVGQECGARGP